MAEDLAPALARRSRFGDGPAARDRDQVQLAEFDGPLGAAAVPDRGAPARRPDGAARGARGRLPRRVGRSRGRPARSTSARSSRSPASSSSSRAGRCCRGAADPGDPTALADEGPDPEAELRARLILYRAYRDAGVTLAGDRARRVGLFRREPAASRGRGRRRRPADRRDRRSTRLRLVRALDRLARIALPPEAAARASGADHHDRPSGPSSSGRRSATRRSSSSRTSSRRPRPGRHRDHVPGDARAHEAARDRRRAGRAVGSDRGPRDDRRGTQGRRDRRTEGRRTPIDETLESFA